MRKVVEVLFDVLNPPLIVFNRIEADISVKSLHLPHIRHEATLTNFHGALTVPFDSPISFPLLLIFNGLFPLVLSRSRAQ